MINELGSSPFYSQKMVIKIIYTYFKCCCQLLLFLHLDGTIFFGRLHHFLWPACQSQLEFALWPPTLTFLPLGDLIENQSISTSSFLLRHNHVAYVSARPQEDLLQTNLSVFIGLVKTSARFSLVWIFCKSTLPSSTTSRTK